MNTVALTLNGEGKLVKIVQISFKDILKCPMVIFLPSHYREDGSCRCNERTCEMDECEQDKFGEEIYCKTHSNEMYGVEEFNEVEG